jgi:hypothetical protein
VKRAQVRTIETDPARRRMVVSLVRRNRLDRRLVYTVLDGKLAAEARFTDKCTGCACDCGDGYPCSHGCGGCHECGYTGKRVVRFAYPVEKHDGSLIEVPK